MRTWNLITAALGLAVATQAQTPVPLPGNPGNVFIEGQQVSVPLPPSSSSHWRAVGYDGRVVAQGNEDDGRANLGKLPIGFFRVTRDGAPEDVTVGVIAPLAAPTPHDSGISIDTSAGIFYQTPKQWKTVASLASLAGMNWERDRFRWRDLEPDKGDLVESADADDETNIMHAAGLRVLEVMQGIPGWATHEGLHLPIDLRDVFNFYRALALRWRGTVEGIEPWNEGDVHSSGAEIASFQKAAYLGMKAGNPDIIVCSSAWSAAMIPAELQEFSQNQVDPYYDTLNFHHYLPLDQLPERYAAWERLANGKPLWVDEFNLNVPKISDPVTEDPSPADMILSAQVLPKLYATSLYLNAQNTFFFVFGSYTENGRQFGLLRKDLTPRPGYLALAAVGRLLAGAKPIAMMHGSAVQEGAVFAFRASPDGNPMDVLVAWDDKATSTVHLPVSPSAVYDNIGRRIRPAGRNGQDLQLGPAPIFIVLPAGTVEAWNSGKSQSQGRPTLVAPPPSNPGTSAPPSPVVLQAVFTDEQMMHSKPQAGPPTASASVEGIGGKFGNKIQMFAYNFSNQPLSITLSVKVPDGWNYRLPVASMTLPPMGRVPVPLEVLPDMGSHGVPGAVQLRASGPNAGNAILEFRLVL